MIELLSLYRQAERQGVSVYHLPLPNTGSLSFQDEKGRCYIGMDVQHRLTETEQRVHLAHELGHCVRGSFYNRYSPCALRQGCELRADKYAVQLLIPQQALDRALALGITEIWELAEHFGVDEPTMKKALCLYTQGNLAAELYFAT